VFSVASLILAGFVLTVSLIFFLARGARVSLTLVAIAVLCATILFLLVLVSFMDATTM